MSILYENKQFGGFLSHVILTDDVLIYKELGKGEITIPIKKITGVEKHWVTIKILGSGIERFIAIPKKDIDFVYSKLNELVNR